MQCVARGVDASFAITTLVTRHMMRNKNSVTHFEIPDFVANFLYDSCCFMAQNNWGFGNTIPLDNIAAANAASHNLQQSLFIADLGDGHFLDSNVMVVIVDGDLQQIHQKGELRLCLLSLD